MARPRDQSNNQTFTALDRDRHRPRLAQLGELDEQRREILLGVLDHPGLDRRAVLIEEAHPVQR